jgi:hypothetical protein
VRCESRHRRSRQWSEKGRDRERESKKEGEIETETVTDAGGDRDRAGSAESDQGHSFRSERDILKRKAVIAVTFFLHISLAPSPSQLHLHASPGGCRQALQRLLSGTGYIYIYIYIYHIYIYILDDVIYIYIYLVT